MNRHSERGAWWLDGWTTIRCISAQLDSSAFLGSTSKAQSRSSLTCGSSINATDAFAIIDPDKKRFFFPLARLRLNKDAIAEKDGELQRRSRLMDLTSPHASFSVAFFHCSSPDAPNLSYSCAFLDRSLRRHQPPLLEACVYQSYLLREI
ncbi:hypothetical protein BD410DRAFT_321631 [Rickenella mellea]|uniref:Uncharacterized protein n=1 Tax=Rickenella mellea TaxID=50990 RepID=A0A4Y7Q258_9AGAM|nr:hypothetical protein BD410DRAFT_321631 [Rickenella mellea]